MSPDQHVQPVRGGLDFFFCAVVTLKSTCWNYPGHPGRSPNNITAELLQPFTYRYLLNLQIEVWF
jgi:hypothetical protein